MRKEVYRVCQLTSAGRGLSLQVSLDAQVREVINKKMQDPTAQAFEDAQLQIYTLMHRDSYPRFLSSNIYKSLAQGSSGTSSES